MADEEKPVEATPQEKPIKTVPLSELITERKNLQAKIRASEEQREENSRQLEELRHELAIARTKMDEDDVAELKKQIIADTKKLEEKEKAFLKKEASYSERERKLRVREMVSEYAKKGLELDEEELLNAEDPRDIVLAAMAEKLTPTSPKEVKKEETPKQEERPSGNFYESMPAGTRNKQVKDMTPEEFRQFEKESLAITMSKR